ncbi:hypothetical protein CR513_48681, partial [Mucuna pruriens]
MHVVLSSRVLLFIALTPYNDFIFLDYGFNRISFLWLGLKLTLPLFVVGGPFEGVVGFSQENWSPNRVVSRTDSSSQDDLLSSSSSGEIFPFEIWYRDNFEDDNSDDPFSWVDSDVKRVSSLYTQESSMLGTTRKICQLGPWSVVVRACRSDEPMNGRPFSDEAPFFFFYEPLVSKLGIKLPFTAFERLVLRALNKVAKVGWMSLSGRPRYKLLKPFLESFKTFKDKFFNVSQGKNDPNILADQSGNPYFPLYWTSQPVVSVTIVR